jgi:hypothetical protein
VDFGVVLRRPIETAALTGQVNFYQKDLSGNPTIRPRPPASEGKPQDSGIVTESANTSALRFEQNSVAGPHLAGREDRRVDSRALPVLLNDAFQNFWA